MRGTFSQCDSMLIGDRCGAHTFPYIDVSNPSAQVEHEATTTKIGEDQIFIVISVVSIRGSGELDRMDFVKRYFVSYPWSLLVEAQKLRALV